MEKWKSTDHTQMYKTQPEPKPEPKPEPAMHPVDELVAALRSMIVSAEAAGGRDRPEVMFSREVLVKLGKPV